MLRLFLHLVLQSGHGLVGLLLHHLYGLLGGALLLRVAHLLLLRQRLYLRKLGFEGCALGIASRELEFGLRCVEWS